MIAATNVLVIF